ncbi:NTP transferase domain-containing protein [Candidatus Pelagibacter sp.]|nr:NTP transferase domain-containing protein [Candidatus Pelagibacter sp.]
MKKLKILNKSFGSFIRKKRLDLGFGQRELAKKIGIAASYLNDIEKEKRTAPKSNIIKKLSVLLKVNLNDLNDLAGISKGEVPFDISEYIKNNPNLISLLRSIRNNNLSEFQIEEINKSISKKDTKALIIAAGLGSRLKKHTEDLPKCMLDFGGKTLLQRQLDAYNKNGVNDISLIKGYKKEKINYKGIRYFENTDYRNNNILNSIFYGEDVINGNIIISYSDILFDPIVVKRTLEAKHDISVVVDIDWRGYYVGRKDHPISEAENVIFNSNNEVLKIGKINTGNEDIHGEFIGMVKLSDRGTEIFKEHFHRLKKVYWNKPFQRAKIFQKAYLTDFIQELVDIGIKIHCVIIESGWKEIDTVEDYKKAIVGFNKKFTKS